MTWGNPKTFVDHMVVNALRPLTIVYGGLLNLHKLSYQTKYLPVKKLPCPVISIGNLTVGGTGKTPIIVNLANQLLSHNFKVGILSRGYKRTNSQILTVAGDGQGNFASIKNSGDEPLMIAKMLPHAVVIVGQDRFLAGQKAINEYACNVLLLDDGFQHWGLERDYDIVLLDYNDEPWNDNLLPAGRLREPLSALARANQVIITKIPKTYDAARIERFKKLITQYSPNCSFSLCHFEPESIRQLIAAKWMDLPLDKLHNLPVIAFSGLAKNESFFKLVNALHANVLQQISFDDHHVYLQNDIEQLKTQLKQTHAEYLITTRKDLVKLEDSAIASRIIAVNLGIEWLTEMPDLSSLLKTPITTNIA